MKRTQALTDPMRVQSLWGSEKAIRKYFSVIRKNLAQFFTFRFSVLKEKKKKQLMKTREAATMWRHVKQSKDIGTGIAMARRQPVALERLMTFLAAIIQRLRVWNSESESSGSDSCFSGYHRT